MSFFRHYRIGFHAGFYASDNLGGIVFLSFYPGCATPTDIYSFECQEAPRYLLDVVVCRDYENLFAGVDYFLLLKDSNVSFPGYQVAGFEFEYSTFFLALLFGLFAEIFALGVKLKEEQDLTV